MFARLIHCVLFLLLVLSPSSVHAGALLPPLKSLRKGLATTLLAVGSAVAPFASSSSSPCFAASPGIVIDTTLADQLKVVQLLQVEKQKDKLDSSKKELANADALLDERELIAKGVVSISPPPDIGLDQSMYPLGYNKAALLDNAFSSPNAALILTAVGREGPPCAAKRITPLSKIDFPYAFEITSKDLLFPYTRDAWIKSPLSSDSIAVTAILDTDGKLTTPSETSRFGFAISDPKSFPVQPPTYPPSSPPPFQRVDARIAINLKSDGKEYSSDDLALLSRIDNELDRLSSSVPKK